MTVFLYHDRGTAVHRLDGRTKVVATLALFVSALIFSDPRYLLVIAGVVLTGAGLAHSLGTIIRFWVLLVLLFLYSSMLWPFFVEGPTPAVRYGGLQISLEGLAFGVGMGLRLDLMVMTGLLLLATTTVEEFALALQRLGLPASVGLAFSLAFRWVPTLLGAGATVVQAQRSRGLDLASGTLIERIRRYPPLVVPLVGHTLRQTTLLAMALESKGFGPGHPRVVYRPSRLTVADFGVFLLMVLLVCLSGWLRWNGWGVLEVGF